MKPDLSLTRREFIQTTAMAGAVATLGSSRLVSAAADAARTEPPPPAWVDRPMRWAQLTLVEDDPGKFDLPRWLDYFQRTRSDAACLSAGGCVAFYPTKIPFHHRSAWLANLDPFGDLVAGCRRLGMTVLARVAAYRRLGKARDLGVGDFRVLAVAVGVAFAAAVAHADVEEAIGSEGELSAVVVGVRVVGDLEQDLGR